MREINCSLIKDTVKELFIKANLYLPEKVECAICRAAESEENKRACNILNRLAENAKIAREDEIPICQDTGMAFVFVKLGQDVHITGGNFNDAINEGVAAAYTEGYLRKSVVADPLKRVNTQDNTPAIIYTEIVPGENIDITAMPKGFGSENMSKLKMFNPTASEDEIIDFVAQTAIEAGGNPCPPTIVGVGIGGSFDYSAVLAKKALMRNPGERSEKYGELEDKILNKINSSGVGPAGLGGRTSCLAVLAEGYPTHIAGLPVAVNISCHATRHAQKII